LQLQRDDGDQEKNGSRRRRTLIRVINRAGSEHLIYAFVAEDIDFSVLSLSYGTALSYSVRSATIGSTLAARAAGIQDARSAAAQSNNVAMVSMRGSHGETPKS
jgi:hypothetical protein